MAKVTHKGTEFDSQEEVEFYEWCLEAVDLGILTGFTYHPASYQLSEAVKWKYIKETQLKTKIKKEEKWQTVLREHKYTLDFILYPNYCFKELFDIPFLYKNQEDPKDPIYIDTKGTFNKQGGERVFKINQKWLYDKHNILVYKVVPKELFQATWVPELARFSPKKRDLRKMYTKTPTKEDIKKRMNV